MAERIIGTIDNAGLLAGILGLSGLFTLIFTSDRILAILTVSRGTLAAAKLDERYGGGPGVMAETEKAEDIADKISKLQPKDLEDLLKQDTKSFAVPLIDVQTIEFSPGTALLHPAKLNIITAQKRYMFQLRNTDAMGLASNIPPELAGKYTGILNNTAKNKVKVIK